MSLLTTTRGHAAGLLLCRLSAWPISSTQELRGVDGFDRVHISLAAN